MDSSREAPPSEKYDDRARPSIAEMRQTAEQLLGDFSRLEKTAIKMSFSCAAMAEAFTRATGEEKTLFARDRARAAFENAFGRLDPYAATLLDLRGELTALEQRREGLAALQNTIAATDDKIRALEAHQWRTYRALLLSWEFKETDRGALLDKAQQRRDALALRLVRERRELDKSAREVRRRFQSHVAAFAREWGSAQERLFGPKLRPDVSEESKPLSPKAATKPAERKGSAAATNGAVSKSRADPPELLSFAEADAPEAPVADTAAAAGPAPPRFKVDGGRLDLWEFKDGARRNIRSLLSSLHSVLWVEALERWGRVELSGLMSRQSVKTHYRKAILLVHPDRAGGDEAVRTVAHRAFHAINVAWKAFVQNEAD